MSICHRSQLRITFNTCQQEAMNGFAAEKKLTLSAIYA